MENQGKRLMLAVGLALAVILGWNMLFPSKKDEPAKPAPGSAAVIAPVTAPGVAPGGTPAAATPEQGPVAEAPRPPEDESLKLEFPGKLTARFSSYGGSLKSWKLADPRFGHDETHGELLPNRTDTGAFFVCIVESECDLARPAAWTGKQVSGREIAFTRETEHYRFDKTFTVDPDAFLVRMKLQVTPKHDQAAPQQVAIVVYAQQDPKLDGGGSSRVAARVWASATMRDGSSYHTPIKQVIKYPRWEDNVQWTGFEHPYLLAGYAPVRSETDNIQKKTWAGEALGAGGGDLMRTDVLFPPVPAKAGVAWTRELIGYLGPKNYKELEAADAAAGFSLGFTHTIDFGWFGVIGRPLLWLLLKFQSLVGNWGIAIVMLTILVKLATLYWTTKSMRSMKAMAALAPQMKALQEKYKDDRQRQQVETMALYKQHNVNPIAGCLPILLQMPIWIALYRMLSSAGELYQEPFIPGWIDDLTNTDPLHILPVVLMITMFAQARLQPATGDSRQQKFLQYGMPLMFGVMSFFFPSGLTVYIFTNTILSALHSIYMNKYDRKSLALAAQMKKNAEAAAAAAAKPAGGKSGGGGGGGGAKGAVKPKPAARPIIDAESSDASASAAGLDDGPDDDDGPGDDGDDPGSKPGPGRAQGAARPRRKKRRR
jgi:YidC/Oxa1 family membrane protein insertase